MKQIKAITLNEAYRRYIERHTKGFHSVSYADEMSFEKFIDRLNNIDRLSIL